MSEQPDLFNLGENEKPKIIDFPLSRPADSDDEKDTKDKKPKEIMKMGPPPKEEEDEPYWKK